MFAPDKKSSTVTRLAACIDVVDGHRLPRAVHDMSGHTHGCFCFSWRRVEPEHPRTKLTEPIKDFTIITFTSTKVRA